MSENQLVEVVKNCDLEPVKSQSILTGFNEYVSKAEKLTKQAFAIVIKDVTQVHDMALAKELKKEAQALWKSAEETHKSLKEQSLREGRAIDGCKNIIKAMIEPIKEHLVQQEKFVELQQQRALDLIEHERLESIRDLQFDVDLSCYDLRNMPEEAFQRLFKSLTDEKAEAQRKIKEAEKAAEDAEKARAAEEKRLKAENAKLKAEAEKREKELEKERAVQAKKDAEEKARIEADRARVQAERAAEEKKHAEELAKQKAEAEKARAEIEKIAREKEAQAKKEAEEAERIAQLGDKGVIEILLQQFKSIGFPQVRSKRVLQKINTAKMLTDDIIHVLEK
jgi:hypothetical protein